MTSHCSLKENFLHRLFVFWIEKMALKHGHDSDGRSNVWRGCRTNLHCFLHDLTDDRNGAMVTHPFEIVVRPYPIPFRCFICARLVGPPANMAHSREKKLTERSASRFAGWVTKGSRFRCHVSWRKEVANNGAEAILTSADNLTDLQRRRPAQAPQRPARSGQARRWPSHCRSGGALIWRARCACGRTVQIT
jgi:hypothetical protein